MKFKYEKNRIYYEDENGKLLAEITFPNVDSETVDLNHTFVDPSLRGQGVAEQLITEAMQVIKNNHMKTLTTCSYAKRWFEEKGDPLDILLK